METKHEMELKAQDALHHLVIARLLKNERNINYWIVRVDYWTMRINDLKYRS